MANNDNRPIRNRHTWLRIVFLILFGVILSFAKYLILLVALLMAIISLFSRTPNKQLQEFGAGLAEYVWQIIRYLTYNSHTKPFPFDDWKQGKKPDVGETAKNTTKTSEKKEAKPASKAKQTTAKTAATKPATTRSRSTTKKASNASSSSTASTS